MPPFKPLPFREVKRRLESLGFTVVSQKGSHIKFAKFVEGGTITTVVPKHREVSPGTLKSIIKQAMISEEEFYNV
jgi:predicted RNA binding protein YcfA (HicA-like mRNA interferase family)